MNFKALISEILFRIRFKEVPNNFNSKDNLFNLTFSDAWVYSKKGNSFYSFHNEKEDLKGGIQISMQWNIEPPGGMTEHEAVVDLIKKEEGDEVNLKKERISKYNCTFYFSNTDESNMDFHNWIIYRKKVLIIIKFMIFEEEPEYIKSKWLNEVTDILNSLELDEPKFQTTRIR